MPKVATDGMAVKATDHERDSGRLTEQNLEIAVRQIRHDGLVVVENAIPEDTIDQLNSKMVEDALVLRARGDDSPFNYNKGNLQQDPPPLLKYFHPEIFLNSIATQITSAILGPRPKLTFLSGNTAMPSHERQPVHSDADFNHPDHQFALVVNVPLISVRPENGSTEVWLGTQHYGVDAQQGAHGERASGRIVESLLEERRRTRPPVQATIPKGSIIVRDLRLWHAGMPNGTQEVRVMIAMIHFAPWYRNGMKIELAEEIRPMVERVKDLDVRVDWVKESEAEERYLNRGFGNSYDFSQTP